MLKKYFFLSLFLLLWGFAIAQKPFMGKVRVVSHNADYKVKIDTVFPDLKVQFVNITPYKTGQWQKVDFGEDFTIMYVSYGEDFSIMPVSKFPGLPNGNSIFKKEQHNLPSQPTATIGYSSPNTKIISKPAKNNPPYIPATEYSQKRRCVVKNNYFALRKSDFNKFFYSGAYVRVVNTNADMVVFLVDSLKNPHDLQIEFLFPSDNQPPMCLTWLFTDNPKQADYTVSFTNDPQKADIYIHGFTRMGAAYSIEDFKAYIKERSEK